MELRYRVLRLRRKDFKTPLQRACVGVHPDALRHTLASRLAVAGVDRRLLTDLGGWSSGSMLGYIYAHSSEGHTAGIMARSEFGPTTLA